MDGQFPGRHEFTLLCPGGGRGWQCGQCNRQGAILRPGRGSRPDCIRVPADGIAAVVRPIHNARGVAAPSLTAVDRTACVPPEPMPRHCMYAGQMVQHALQVSFPNQPLGCPFGLIPADVAPQPPQPGLGPHPPSVYTRTCGCMPSLKVSGLGKDWTTLRLYRHSVRIL